MNENPWGLKVMSQHCEEGTWHNEELDVKLSDKSCEAEFDL